MARILTICITCLATSGCFDKLASHTDFSWAMADQRRLERYLTEKITDANPMPAKYVLESRTMNTRRSELHKAINDLNREIDVTCREKVAAAESADTTTASTGNRHPATVHLSRNQNQVFEQQRCIQQATDSNPKLTELIIARDKLEDIRQFQNNRQRRIREYAQAYAKDLIRQYAESQYQIVINQQELLYNRSGLALDITDALITEADKAALTLPDEG